LPAWSRDELHLRQVCDDLHGCGQLVGADQQFVDKSGRANRFYAVADIRAQKPVGIGFVLHPVPDADERDAAGQFPVASSVGR
jgi:hypothetical protein